MGTYSWIRRTSIIAVTAIMTGFGITSVASAQTITNTGPDSTNRIDTSVTNTCTITNSNKVSVNNVSNQNARSGDAETTGNTNAGAAWAGWPALNPAVAQANGTSYAAWRTAVTDWIGQRAAGAGWNSSETNLTWTGGESWAGYDPLAWQGNGQNFANWYNATQNYLNANSSAWILGWPANATGGMSLGGATSGSASNTNNASFSIAINNAARGAAGTDSCGHSLFTPPSSQPPAGGSGGGVVQGVTTSSPVGTSGGSGGGSGGFGGVGGSGFSSGGSGFVAPHAPGQPAVMPESFPSSPAGSGGGAPQTPSQPVVKPVSSISNTGPGSTNAVSSTYTNNSSVQNTNVICVSNTSTQSASTGDATTSGNTATGGAGTGGATNGNDTGAGGTVTN